MSEHGLQCECVTNILAHKTSFNGSKLMFKVKSFLNKINYKVD